MTPTRHGPPPRIFYVEHPDGGLGSAAAEGARLGFSHLMIPPPFQPGARGDRFAPASLERLDPAWGGADLAALVATAQAAGLGLMLDVPLHRLARGTGESLGAGLFQAPDTAALLDPRHAIDWDADVAAPADAGAAEALGRFWGEYIAHWTSLGVAGFRLIGLGELASNLLPALLAGLREAAPEAALYGWTAGVARDAMAGLEGAGLAGVFPSLPWWDFTSPWFWRDVEALRRVAPLLGAPAAPGEAPPAPSPAVAPALFHRAASLAAGLGGGWLAVQGCHKVAGADLRGAIKALNEAVAKAGTLDGALTLPAGVGGDVVVLMRAAAPDLRCARRVLVTVANTQASRASRIDAALLLAPLGGRGELLRPDGAPVQPGAFPLAPGEAVLLTASLAPCGGNPARLTDAPAKQAAASPRLGIERVMPAVDGGAFPIKRIAGEAVAVTADVVFDGHGKIAVALRYRAERDGAPDAGWTEQRMRPLGNDAWQADFPLLTLGAHEFVVLAWYDEFETYRDEIAKKHAAGVDITVELAEGIALLRRIAAGAAKPMRAEVMALAAALEEANPDARRSALLSADVAALMARADPRRFLVQSAVMPVEAERLGARYASWYEVFPRSLSDDVTRHGNFADVIRHLPRVRDMGFDVLYFPPIHPIGRSNRKGRNNSLTPAADDPGSPYAIGGDAGGHDALHPQLGTMEDFQRLRGAAEAHGLELALDFAVQCSPDHPWLREHKGWFDWRPDGTIKYAENPPKKYEDIVNVDFYAPDAVPGLWLELCRIVLFWADHGVRLFRVDNPHTKPFPFWQWLIREVRQRFPDAIFLAEAFTRPKIMNRLAKIGFSQSYTYFTWRNSKSELQAYLTTLSEGPEREFFRPHFFVNTPDINPIFLQQSGRAGFLIRAALAATLSGLWGVYNGFELCEADAIPGKEEYLGSEKYQLRAWDWNRPGNIVAEVTALNRIRAENPALQTHLGVQFHNAFNEAIIYFEKASPDRSNVVLIAISLDPHQPQEADFEVPLWNWGLNDGAALDVEDLLTGDRHVWRGKIQHVRLTPEHPYAIWRAAPAA